MKQVNFPPEIERGDINASTPVSKVSRAIQKRVSKLMVHKEKLEGTTNKTDVHVKLLWNFTWFFFWLCGFL